MCSLWISLFFLIKCNSSSLSSISASPNLYISDKILIAVLTNHYLNAHFWHFFFQLFISILICCAEHFALYLFFAWINCRQVPGLLIRSLAQNSCLPSMEINPLWIPMGMAGLTVCVGKKHTQLKVCMSAIITSQTMLQWWTEPELPVSFKKGSKGSACIFVFSYKSDSIQVLTVHSNLDNSGLVLCETYIEQSLCRILQAGFTVQCNS